MLPVKIQTNFFNLTYFNANPNLEPHFTPLYEFKQEYKLNDLRPSNI